MKYHSKICCNRLDYYVGYQSITGVIFQNQIVLNTFQCMHRYPSSIISHPIRSELEAFIEESVNFGVVVFLDPPINVK